MGRKTVVVGAGFGGLSAAALLARAGHDVTVLDNNDRAGGRATVWDLEGYRFDLGPSWYLMPDVFDRFFRELGTSAADELDLRRLSPAYRVFFGPGDSLDMPGDLDAACELFETLEPGGADKLRRYVAEAAEQYHLAMGEFIYRDYDSWRDLFDRQAMAAGRQLKVLTRLDDYVRTWFRSDRARKVLEYNMVFLGGSPENTPAMYSLMSHIDLNLGVWYPMGGIGAVVEAIQRLAEAAGARFRFGCPVRRIVVEGSRVTGVATDDETIPAEVVVANADYRHVEMELLEPQHRQYGERYWSSRVIGPSSFVAYVGVEGRIEQLAHHTLFLEADWMTHFNSIYRRPAWPERAPYYVCCPSRTDPAMAPPGGENLFVLVPVAAGLDDPDDVRERQAEWVLGDLERQLGRALGGRMVVRRLFSHRDFTQRYNAYRGTALGLAHTLRQTAIFRPRHRSRKVEGLYYTGQYCHPGVGMPMTLISSQILARELRA